MCWMGFLLWLFSKESPPGPKCQLCELSALLSTVQAPNRPKFLAWHRQLVLLRIGNVFALLHQVWPYPILLSLQRCRCSDKDLLAWCRHVWCCSYGDLTTLYKCPQGIWVPFGLMAWCCSRQRSSWGHQGWPLQTTEPKFCISKGCWPFLSSKRIDWWYLGDLWIAWTYHIRRPAGQKFFYQRIQVSW